MGNSRSGDRFELQQQNSVADSLSDDAQSLEEYKKRLRRRRKKASDGCWNLTCYSWFFLLIALLQAAVVTGIQIAIAVLGHFRTGERLEGYVNCSLESLENILGHADVESIDLNVTSIELPSNFTYPSFGKDKEIYVYFFITVVLYNFFLCLYALKFQNIVEVYMFMVINILAMLYAGLQVYQFRNFGPLCEPITNVGYLALANGLVLLIFTFVFAFLSLFIYVEFGWKTYVLVDCNPGMRYYYRVYQVFMSILKLFLLFSAIYCVSQDALLLEMTDPEFYLTILLCIVAISSYPVIYLIVTFEFLLGAIALLFLGLSFVAYYIFKIYRHTSLNCNICRQHVQEVDSELTYIISQLGGVDPNGEIKELLNRGQEFLNLTIFAAVSLAIDIILIIVFIHYWRQWGKGLKGYFGKSKLHQWISKHFCCWCEKCGTSSESSRDTIDTWHRRSFAGVSLALFDRKTKGRKNGANRDFTVSRDSTRLEQSTYNHDNTSFDPPAPNDSQKSPIN